MNITKIDLPNGSRMFLMDNCLPDDTIRLANEICNRYPVDTELWWPLDWTEHRFEVNKDHPLAKQLWKKIIQFNIPDHLEFRTKHNLVPNAFTMWIDLPGMGTLQPHVEGVDGTVYLCQLYITKQSHSTNGTTIYTDDKKVLMQLPYRNNLGWFFDTADQVMHGREHPTPPDLQRFSLMVWYDIAK